MHLDPDNCVCPRAERPDDQPRLERIGSKRRISRQEANLALKRTILKVQYQYALATMVEFGVPIDNVPSWQLISLSLTSDKLQGMDTMDDSTFMLVPPLSFEKILEIINLREKACVPMHDGFFAALSEDIDSLPKNLGADLDGEDVSQGSLLWEAWIVEGAPNVPIDMKVQRKKGYCLEGHAQVEALLEDFDRKKLAALRGARKHIAAIMRALGKGHPLDTLHRSVVNAHMVQANPQAPIIVSDWNNGQVRFSTIARQQKNPIIGVRKAIDLSISTLSASM